MEKGSLLQKERILKKARWYNHRNRAYKACVCYLEFLKAHPDHKEALEELAGLYFDRGDVELAIICLKRLDELEKLPAHLAMKLCSCYMQNGSWSLARKVLLEDHFWDEETEQERLLSLGNCEMQIGTPLVSLLRLQKLIEKQPSPLYFLLQAEILEEIGMVESALEVCKRGLKRDPYFEDLLAIKLRLHLELDEWGSAKKIALKMIRNQMYMEEVRFDIEEWLFQNPQNEEMRDLLRYFDETPDYIY